MLNIISIMLNLTDVRPKFIREIHFNVKYEYVAAKNQHRVK